MAGSGTNFLPAPPRGRSDGSAGAPALLQGKQMTANNCVRPLRDASKPHSCASAPAAGASRGMSRIRGVSRIMQMPPHLAHPRLQLPHLGSRYTAHFNQSICSILLASARMVAGAGTVGRHCRRRCRRQDKSRRTCRHRCRGQRRHRRLAGAAAALAPDLPTLATSQSCASVPSSLPSVRMEQGRRGAQACAHAQQ